MSKATTKKVLGILSKVFAGIIIAVTVGMMIFTIISVTTFDRNDRNLFGIRFYIVLTDSMSPSENNKDLDVHFNAGDIVLIKDAEDPTALQPGDVIAFISQNSVSFGETVTHMIREVRTTTDGKLIGYVTYGTNTGTDDETIVEPAYVLGVYAGKLPKVGEFFQFLRTTPGYIVCILVPFMLLILYQGVNTVRLFKRYKKEQNEEIENERAQIAEERKQNAETAAAAAEMMRELQALREQLAQQGVQIPTQQTEQGTDAEETSSAADDNSDSNA